jgi:Mn2+/Fe2+ NRAMP family transporter
MAGMAIGVSHLMQSTRAGAGFGFQLVGLVIAVHLAKYPFFEYGHRYAAATGESLLHGYLRLGRGALVAFFLIHTVTSVVGIAAIVFVTTALAQNLFQFGLNTTVWSALLIGSGITLVIVGRFRGLDLVIRIMLAVLVVSTALALAAAVWHGPVAPEKFQDPSPWQAANLGFLIALMGWMPAAIEVSVFQSLWLVARDEATGRRVSMADALFDFNLGYGLTTVMAVVFLSLGALVMYGSAETFASSNVDFASQLVGMYGQTLGEWIRPVMAVVALVAMLSTTLTSIDASPRSLAVAQSLLQRRESFSAERLHAVWMIGVGLAALLIIYAFQSRFTQFIDLVTTFSFLAAPVFAFLNMRLIASPDMPEDARPGPATRVLALAGFVFLVGFGLLWVIVRFDLLGP